jgi:hypothetical protein
LLYEYSYNWGSWVFGSHITRLLENTNHSVIITDYKIDGIDLSTNYDELNLLFVNNNIDAVIHTAAQKSVGESVEEPEQAPIAPYPHIKDTLIPRKNSKVIHRIGWFYTRLYTWLCTDRSY